MSDTSQQWPKVVQLPSGKTATINKSKGKHIREAQKLSSDDSSLYMNALMSQLIEYDGRFLVMEEYDEMDGEDYMELLKNVSDVFMSLVPKT